MPGRFAATVTVLALAPALVACSGGSHAKATRTSGRSPCALLRDLDRTAERVATADISDPEAWKHTLSDAVAHYAATVRELRAVAPPRLGGDLDRVESAVLEYRFGDAAAARAPIDLYEADTCGRSAASTSISSPTPHT